VGAIALGLVAAVAFVLWELFVDRPMLDPRLFSNRAFSAGTLTVTVQFFASFGLFFVVIQYLQYVAGRSPLEAAVCLLPLPLVMIPLARNAPKIARKVGFRRLAPVGLSLTALGLVVISQVDADLEYWYFALGIVLFAAGMALAGTPATTAITQSLPVSKQGVASAVNDTARELGSAFGIAILGSVLDQAYRNNMTDAVQGLPPDVADAAQSSIAATQTAGMERLGETGQQLMGAAQTAFVDGLAASMLLAAGIVAVAAVLVAILAPSGRASHGAKASDEEAATQDALAHIAS
jgi:Na+/melibiose symporter-like transporter